MNSEIIIRNEAKNFAERKVRKRFSKPDEHKDIIKEVKYALHDLYSPESKMIFLDEIFLAVKEKQDAHNETCTKGEDCPTNIKFETILFYIQQEIDSLPKIIKQTTEVTSSKREKVFISYSHADKDWLNLIKRHFKPLESKVDFWDDSKIKPGQIWKDEIEFALNEAKIGILLLSADFFNSDFILNNELPPLLESAEKDGATILSVILKPCMFEEYPQISCYQAINSPSNSVIQMDEGRRELTFVELVKQVKEIVESNG